MSFATEIIKPDLDKFSLVRLKPRKYLGLGYHYATDTYRFSYEYTVYANVYINGVIVDSANVSVSGGYIFVVSTNDLTSSAHVTTVEIPFYITGTMAMDTHGNTASLPEAIWEPILTSYPQWGQSIKNIGETIFTISSTNLNVIIDNRWFQNTLDTSFSWNRAEVDVWVCIGDVNTSKRIFSGEVSNISIKGNIASIDIVDSFNSLTKKAEFGTSSQAYYWSVPPEHLGKPKPFVIGITSPAVIERGYRISEAYGTTASTEFYHQTVGITCVPVDSDLDTSTSVRFSVGRIIGNSLKKLSFGTISRAYEHYMVKVVYSDGANMEVGVRLLYLQCSSINTLRIGDYVPGQGNICSIGSFTHAGNSYNVAIVENTSYFFDGASTYTSGSIPVPSISNDVHPSISVWIEGTEDASYEVSSVTLGLVPLWAIPVYSGRYVPFTVSYETSYDPGIDLDVTEVYVTITSLNISSSSKPLLPGKQKFLCRFSPNSPLTHAEALKIVCKGAGLTVNSTSFTQADSDLDSSVAMTIPPFGQGEFPSYLGIAQSIIKSTFGILRINSDREVEYKIIKSPDMLTSIGNRDDSNIIVASFSTNVDYQDTVNQIKFENDEYKDRECLSINGPSVNEDSNVVRYLHKTDRTIKFSHVLANIYGSKDAIFQYLSNPKIEYNFETASVDLNSNIGDVVSLDNDAVASSSEQVNAMIVSVNSTTNKTNIKTNELRGVP